MYRSLSQDYQPPLPVRLEIHFQHRFRRTQQKTPRQVHRPCDVEVHAVKYWETSCAGFEQSKHENKDINQVQGNLLRNLPEWFEDFAEKSGGRRSVSIKGYIRKHFSWIRPRTPFERGIKEAQYFYSLPEGPKFRSMQDDLGCGCSLQEANWWFGSSSRTSWWLDHSRSQSSQWRLWISKQSPIRSRGARFGHSINGCNRIRARQNLLGEQKRDHRSFSSRQPSAKSFVLTILESLAKLAKNNLGIIVRQHRTDRKLMVLQKEQPAESRKELLQCCCNPVWMKSGGLIPWNVTVIWRNVQDYLSDGKTLLNGALENHLVGQWFLSDQWLSIIRFLPKTLQDPQFGEKVLPGIFPGHVLFAGGVWKGDIMTWWQTLRSWNILDVLGDSM